MWKGSGSLDGRWWELWDLYSCDVQRAMRISALVGL